jgi:pimeloyl-ACP methyl ester carboxylesterase
MRHLKRLALFGGLGLLILLLVVVVEFFVMRGGTPPIRDAAGHRSPRAIAALEWPVLGGSRQAVLLRGADTANPVVLFLHGGPGMPAMYLAHAFQRPLERDFVMVQWDRRGAGKSYGARLPAESLTVRRTLADLYELTQRLRSRFHQDRIYLVAHSWGTYLGLVAVAEHPEWYRAFVGMGQLVPDTQAAHAAQRALVLEEARRRGDTAIVARLQAPGMRVRESEMFAMGGELRSATSFWPLLRTGLAAPEYTLLDAWNVQRGAQLLGAVLDGSAGPALPAAGSTLKVPVFLFLGRYDYNTPSATASAYLDSLAAPLKGAVWFERSAHFPFFEEPERFHQELRRVDSLVTRYWTAHVRC